MPIHKFDGKVVVKAGVGDIVWSPASDRKDGKPEYVLMHQGQAGAVNRELPELKGALIENWDVKIVLPCKGSWLSLMQVLKDYAKQKWGEIPEESDRTSCAQEAVSKQPTTSPS